MGSLPSRKRKREPFRITRRLLACLLMALGLAIVLVNLYLVLLHSSPQSTPTLHDGSPQQLLAAAVSDAPRRPPPALSLPSSAIGDKRTGSGDDEERILRYFREAGVALDDATLQELPPWSQIVELFGVEPMVLGLDRCDDFRRQVPAVDRLLGAAGLFNSGTNLMTQLMKENCKIPERVEKYGADASKEAHGIRWQVPWGKHTPAKYRLDHAAKLATDINKEHILPVVTVRDPYNWMRSMCRNSYTARWPHNNICPHLVDPRTGKHIAVKARFAEREEWYDTLAHMWNEWYRQYDEDASYPFLMVRFEDLIFRPKETTEIVCKCAGGVLPSEFKYIVNSAKNGPGHGRKEERTGMVKAWTQYGAKKEIMGGFSDADYQASKRFLQQKLMGKFGYTHPPPS